MSKKILQNSVFKNQVEAYRTILAKEVLQIVKTLKFTLIFISVLFYVNENFANGTNNNEKFFGTSSQICSFLWTVQISGTTALFNSVSTVSDQIGWAAGDGPTIRRTIDGGMSWTNATGTGITGDVYSIYASDENIAFCTTTPLFGTTPSFIYRTSNGGISWSQVYATAVNGFIDAIQMISPTEGYAVGDPLSGVWTLLKTTNAGITWVQMASAPSQIGSETGYNNSFYILENGIWFGTNATRVYHSADKGLTWSNASTNGSVNTYSVHYNSSTNGLAGGNAIVASTNGGTSYTLATSPGTTGNINGIEGDGTNWWSIRSGAIVYRSTNQGGTWTSEYTQTGAVFQDIDFKVVNGCPTGWAVGNGGVIARMRVEGVGISNGSGEVPTSYLLKQNIPNPFNPTTNINFSIPKSGFVTLKVYDMVGKEVVTLVNEVKNAGNYIVGFNAASLPSGAYFYRIETNNFVDTKKMLLIK